MIVASRRRACRRGVGTPGPSRPLASFAAAPWEAVLSVSGADLDGDATLLAQLREQLSAARTVPCVRPRIYVSACLLGHPVTYHGKASGWAMKASSRSTALGHLVDVMGARLGLVDIVPFCPELQLLHQRTPRHRLRLVHSHGKDGADASRFLTDARTGTRLWEYDKGDVLHTGGKREDWTLPPYLGELVPPVARGEPLPQREHVRQAVEDWLAGADGVVFKARSPSCGLQDARIFHEHCCESSAGDGPIKVPKGETYDLVDGFFAKMIRELSANADGTPGLVLTTEQKLVWRAEENAGKVHTLKEFLASAFTHAEARCT